MEEALNYFNQALDLKPTDAQIYFNLGLIYERLGDQPKSLKAFSIALNLRPEWVEARMRVAVANAQHGRCADALKLIDESPVKDSRFQQIIDHCR